MARTYDHVWRQVRLMVLARDAHLCQLRLAGCGVAATCVDHIVPVSEGGARLDPENLRASCQHCNLARNSNRLAKLGAELASALSSPDEAFGPSRRW